MLLGTTKAPESRSSFSSLYEKTSTHELTIGRQLHGVNALDFFRPGDVPLEGKRFVNGRIVPNLLLVQLTAACRDTVARRIRKGTHQRDRIPTR